MTHLSCAPCRLRFDPRRTPDLDACPTCGGALTPLGATDALGFALFRAESAPAWTSALAAALEQPTGPAHA